MAERLLFDDGVGPVSANMQSLNMLICTEGKERTPGEYARHTARGRFHAKWMPAPDARDAVLALKILVRMWPRTCNFPPEVLCPSDSTWLALSC